MEDEITTPEGVEVEAPVEMPEEEAPMDAPATDMPAEEATQ